jgi:hypothetical protein
MMRAGLFLVATLLPSFAAAAPGGDLPTTAQVIDRAIVAYAKVDDYSCMLARRELLDDKIKDHTTVVFKYKRSARHYMRWPGDWIEAIYAEGKYDDKMVIHGGHLFDFARVAVDPAEALKYNRHTIKEAGVGYVLDLMTKNYRQALTDHDATIVVDGEGAVDERPTWHLSGEFPPGRGYYGHRVYVDVDKASALPVKIEVRGWKDEFLEMYTYTKLKLNIGLTEEDFDINNPNYKFGAGK